MNQELEKHFNQYLCSACGTMLDQEIGVASQGFIPNPFDYAILSGGDRITTCCPNCDQDQEHTYFGHYKVALDVG